MSDIQNQRSPFEVEMFRSMEQIKAASDRRGEDIAHVTVDMKALALKMSFIERQAEKTEKELEIIKNGLAQLNYKAGLWGALTALIPVISVILILLLTQYIGK